MNRPGQRALPRYDGVAIALHWATVLLVVAVGTLGLLHDSWPDATQAVWINVHAVMGLLLWLLVLVRLAWRAGHPPPPEPVALGAWSRRLSAPVHALLYVLLVITPVIGIVTFVYHGRIFDFGLFRFDTGVHKDRAIFNPTEDLHGYLAYAIFGLAALHALAALWHRFRLRDGVMERMWPS